MSVRVVGRSILLFQFLFVLKKVKIIKAEETMMNSVSVRDNSFATRVFLKDKLSHITYANS